jgi:hypothetical protein
MNGVDANGNVVDTVFSTENFDRKIARKRWEALSKYAKQEQRPILLASLRGAYKELSKYGVTIEEDLEIRELMSSGIKFAVALEQVKAKR